MNNGFKNVTLRVPKGSTLYSQIKEHVAQGDSWSGATLKILTEVADDEPLVQARAQAEAINHRLREERKEATQKIEEAQRAQKTAEDEKDQVTKLLIALFQWVSNNGVPK